MKTDELAVTTRTDALAGERVLHIQVGVEGVSLNADEGAVSWHLPARWQGLLVSRGALRIVAGEAQVRPLADVCLAKLQVFVDMGVEVKRARSVLEPWAVLAMPAGMGIDRQSLEPWYLARALGDDADYQVFAEVLRQTPHYWLVRFLLEQGTASEKLIALARRYGVSVSHFRRLCHQALGCAAKPELRDWRTAKALLTMIRGEGSLTDIALEFGYASSSHFSKEVRELLGVAPSRLADIVRSPER